METFDTTFLTVGETGFVYIGLLNCSSLCRTVVGWTVCSAILLIDLFVVSELYGAARSVNMKVHGG